MRGLEFFVKIVMGWRKSKFKIQTGRQAGRIQSSKKKSRISLFQ
jgi:hypothetical protein